MVESALENFEILHFSSKMKLCILYHFPICFINPVSCSQTLSRLHRRLLQRPVPHMRTDVRRGLAVHAACESSSLSRRVKNIIKSM